MYKFLVSFIFFSSSSFASAAPNIWSHLSRQGFDLYSINDAQGNKLEVSCFGGTERFDHDVKFTFKSGKEISNSDQKYPLSFIFDDEREAIPTATTTWNSGASQWYDFVAISKATKIEVFVNEKLITTFRPPSANVKRVISDLNECEPLINRNVEST